MPSHTGGAVVPEEKKGIMDQHSSSLAKHNLSSTAQLGQTQEHGWVLSPQPVELSCGHRHIFLWTEGLWQQTELPCRASPEAAPHKTHRYILGQAACAHAQQCHRLLTQEKPRELQAVRGHGPSAHTKPAALFQQHLLVGRTLSQHTGSLPQESPSVSPQPWTPPTTDVCLHL